MSYSGKSSFSVRTQTRPSHIAIYLFAPLIGAILECFLEEEKK